MHYSEFSWPSLNRERYENGEIDENGQAHSILSTLCFSSIAEYGIEKSAERMQERTDRDEQTCPMTGDEDEYARRALELFFDSYFDIP